jgi:hypothetical protein
VEHTERRTSRHLKRDNRAAILRHIYIHGPASRLDVALRTGVSAATVTNIVSDLLRSAW